MFGNEYRLDFFECAKLLFYERDALWKFVKKIIKVKPFLAKLNS
jgi:hypothetical protein